MSIRRFLLLFLGVILISAACNMPTDPFVQGGREKVINYGKYIIMLKADNFAFDYAKAFPPESHAAKRNYRIVPPLIAKACGIDLLRKSEFLAYLVLCGCIFYAISRDGSSWVALAATLAMVCTSSGACYFNDWGTAFDVMAHALIALSVVLLHPAAAIALTALALLTDERAVLMIPVAACIATIHRGSRYSLYYLYGLAVYGAVRLAPYFAYYDHGTDYHRVGSWDIVLANLRMLPLSRGLVWRGGGSWSSAARFCSSSNPS